MVRTKNKRGYPQPPPLALPTTPSDKRENCCGVCFSTRLCLCAGCSASAIQRVLTFHHIPIITPTIKNIKVRLKINGTNQSLTHIRENCFGATKQFKPVFQKVLRSIQFSFQYVTVSVSHCQLQSFM